VVFNAPTQCRNAASELLVDETFGEEKEKPEQDNGCGGEEQKSPDSDGSETDQPHDEPGGADGANNVHNVSAAASLKGKCWTCARKRLA
jgi:hypothetical protein